MTGETTKLRAGDPLPATSPFFDGARVRLRAARGETLGVVVWRRGEGEVPVTLAIDGAEVRGYRVAHHAVRRASTRMYGPSRGAGSWPDRLEPVDGAVPAARAAFFDVVARRAGDGTLTVGDRTFPVTLELVDVELPPLAPRVWGYFDPREIERAGGDEAAFAAVFRGYGMVASPDLGLDDWPAKRKLLRGFPWVPVYLPADPDEEAAAVRGWVAALDGTGQRPFAIPVDEPRRLWQKLVARARAANVRRAGGGAFAYAVTDTPHLVYGDLVDVFISPHAGRGHWTYNGTPPFAGAMILDTDGAALRTWGWIAHRYDVPVWYVWDVAYWSDRHNVRKRGGPRFPPPTELDADAVTFDDGDDRGNLDGVLAYWTAAGPAPSWRLAALRRGLQDRALLELLAACDAPAADALARELVPRALAEAGPRGASRPGAWPADEPTWEAARQRLLDALVACR